MTGMASLTLTPVARIGLKLKSGAPSRLKSTAPPVVPAVNVGIVARIEGRDGSAFVVTRLLIRSV